MVNDHLSDFIARLRNAYNARLDSLESRRTNTVLALARVLEEEGFVGEVAVKGDRMNINLIYKGKKAAITKIVRVSTPGVRKYVGVKKLPRVLGGMGISIVSTPKGIMSNKSAKKLNMGGEIIALVY